MKALYVSFAHNHFQDAKFFFKLGREEDCFYHLLVAQFYLTEAEGF